MTATEKLAGRVKRAELRAKLREANKGGALDRVVSRLIGRKFVAVVAATVLLVLGHIAPGDWIVVLGIWLGLQGVEDLVAVRSRVVGASSATSSDEPDLDDEAGP